MDWACISAFGLNRCNESYFSVLSDLSDVGIKEMFSLSSFLYFFKGKQHMIKMLSLV